MLALFPFPSHWAAGQTLRAGLTVAGLQRRNKGVLYIRIAGYVLRKFLTGHRLTKSIQRNRNRLGDRVQE